MLDSLTKSNLRSSLFRHLDGIVVAPTAFALYKAGVTDYLLTHGQVELESVVHTFNANDGYLNIALRVLASQGWLARSVNEGSPTITYKVTPNGEIALGYIDLYTDAVELIKISGEYHHRKFNVTPFLMQEEIFFKLTKRYNLKDSADESVKVVQDQLLKHIEGVILGPTIVHLGMSGMFHKYFMEASFKPEEFHQDADSFSRLLRILVHYNWFELRNGTYKFTEQGLFFAKRASAYGVTVSYIPTFRKLDELIFGDPLAAKNLDTKTTEGHVDREMNVWGSGGAHSSYFKVVDDIIIELFNKPIAEQPKGILDMGCGNGAFIAHLFHIISLHTLRGKMLDDYPLILIGADYNDEALKISKANLIQADIWAKVVHGDISKPGQLSDDLDREYEIDMKDLLQVRSFLDHNRTWEDPSDRYTYKVSSSTGAFASNGRKIDANIVEASLLEHFEKWAPFTKRHGLLIIELHTVDPEKVAENLGKTASTAYDATHGFSDQYIVELDIYMEILKKAGFKVADNLSWKFPNSELATVSINYLT